MTGLHGILAIRDHYQCWLQWGYSGLECGLEEGRCQKLGNFIISVPRKKLYRRELLSVLPFNPFRIFFGLAAGMSEVLKLKHI